MGGDVRLEVRGFMRWIIRMKNLKFFSSLRVMSEVTKID